MMPKSSVQERFQAGRAPAGQPVGYPLFQSATYGSEGSAGRIGDGKGGIGGGKKF